MLRITLAVSFLAFACASDPNSSATKEGTPSSALAAVTPGFLFGGASDSVQQQRDVADCQFSSPFKCAGKTAAFNDSQSTFSSPTLTQLRAQRTDLDGFPGSANVPGDIAGRVQCDASANITAEVSLHAPGSGNETPELCFPGGSTTNCQTWATFVGLVHTLAKTLNDPSMVSPSGSTTLPTIYVRYGKEMNQGATQGNCPLQNPNGPVVESDFWLTKNAKANGFDPVTDPLACGKEFIKEWNMVADAFHGTTVALANPPNVQMVWCPTGQLDVSNALSAPASSIPFDYWPGAGQVDVVGPDGYNGNRTANATPTSTFFDFLHLASAATVANGSQVGFAISETGVLRSVTTGIEGGKCGTAASCVDSNWWSDLFTLMQEAELGTIPVTAATPKINPVDVIGVAGFWNDTSFGATWPDENQRSQMAATFLNPNKNAGIAGQRLLPAGSSCSL
ncbi:MAG TPA: hypothetical protein VGH20_02760 [Myxococcales bacterium]|jgi:hypothetical protein